MSINSEVVVVFPVCILFVVVSIILFLKKRKKSAKSIYKLIDDLEKKYID